VIGAGAGVDGQSVGCAGSEERNEGSVYVGSLEKEAGSVNVGSTANPEICAGSVHDERKKGRKKGVSSHQPVNRLDRIHLFSLSISNAAWHVEPFLRRAS